jgi:hypothetical protein
MAIMNTGNQANNALAEAAEKIRREAYQAGWRDAVAALSKAAQEAAELSPDDMGGGDFGTPSGSQQSANGVSQGSTPWYVLQAVRKRPGMTGSEVISVVHEGGHRVSEASIRTSLMRLERKKLIISRHKKWFSA